MGAYMAAYMAAASSAMRSAPSLPPHTHNQQPHACHSHISNLPGCMPADEAVGVHEHAAGDTRRLTELLVPQRAPLDKSKVISVVMLRHMHLLGQGLATLKGSGLDGDSLHAPGERACDV